MAAVQTRGEVFTEAMDEIMRLFYKPSLGRRRHYCCEPEQIANIKKFVNTLLDECQGGNTINFRANVIPDTDRRMCTNPSELPSLEENEMINVTLGTKYLYTSAILCYYITSRISGGYTFDVHEALRVLMPDNDATSIIYRTSISEFILKKLLFPSNDDPCIHAIREFRTILMSMKDNLTEDALSEWANLDTTRARAERTQIVNKAQDEIIHNFLERMRKRSGGKSKRKKKSKRKSRRV